jgi:hypothetical protein
MPDITISVGTELHVSAAVPATYDVAGYEALAWTEVGEVESVPAFGGKATVTEFVPVKTGVVNKKKGSINYGNTTVPLAQILSDAGQIALKSGFDGANKAVVHSFKLVNATIGVVYFTAEITGYTYNFGNANAITKNEVDLAVKTKPVVDVDVWTLTYVAGSNGTIVGQATQLVLDGEDGVAVYAAPAALYEFTQWNDASTENPRTDTPTASVTYTATFTLI